MKRKERGIARSDMTHMIMCIDSGVRRDEVPEIVMRRLRLRKGSVGLRLHGVNDVGKLDRILDEEDRDVVADEVPVAFLGIELDGKAAHVAGEVEEPFEPATVEKRTKAGVFSPARWKMSARVYLASELVGLEIAVRSIAAGMNHAFRNALVVEMENLLAEMKVLDQRRTARADLERVLII